LTDTETKSHRTKSIEIGDCVLVCVCVCVLWGFLAVPLGTEPRTLPGRQSTSELSPQLLFFFFFHLYNKVVEARKLSRKGFISDHSSGGSNAFLMAESQGGTCDIRCHMMRQEACLCVFWSLLLLSHRAPRLYLILISSQGPCL
jgi:hypothetical protein